MTRIIKSADVAELAAVRPLGAHAQPAIVVSRNDEERDQLRRRLATLEGELRVREVTLEELREANARAYADGEAAGISEGLKQAADRQGERVALLDDGIRQANATLTAQLGALDRLSAQLVRDCLEKLFGDPEHQAERVTQILGVQLARIERAALVAVEVSREDFPDDEALGELAARHQLTASRLTALRDLPMGGCVLVLRLGRMEIGLDQQWTSLKGVLDAIAEPA